MQRAILGKYYDEYMSLSDKYMEYLDERFPEDYLFDEVEDENGNTERERVFLEFIQKYASKGLYKVLTRPRPKPRDGVIIN